MKLWRVEQGTYGTIFSDIIDKKNTANIQRPARWKIKAQLVHYSSLRGSVEPENSGGRQSTVSVYLQRTSDE